MGITFSGHPMDCDIQLRFQTTYLKQSRKVKALLMTHILNLMENSSDFYYVKYLLHCK